MINCFYVRVLIPGMYVIHIVSYYCLLGYRWGTRWTEAHLRHHQREAGDRGQRPDGRQHRQRGGGWEVLWNHHRSDPVFYYCQQLFFSFRRHKILLTLPSCWAWLITERGCGVVVRLKHNIQPLFLFNELFSTQVQKMRRMASSSKSCFKRQTSASPWCRRAIRWSCVEL